MSVAERTRPGDALPGRTVEVLPQGAEDPPPGVRTMAMVRWALVGVMAVAAAAAWIHLARPASGAAAHAAAQFHCPMHPSVVQDQAGDCPICGMRLVALAAREPEAIPAGAGVAGLAPVSIEPERLQLIGVRTAQVARRHLAPQLRTVGFVVADEDRLKSITVRFSGYVKDVRVKGTVARVRKGDVLASIYSPDLTTPQLSFVNSVRWRKAGGAPNAPPSASAPLPDDPRRRLMLLGVSEQDLVEIERKLEPLQELKIRSPVDGWAIGNTLRDGSYVEPGAELFQIADLSKVWVIADVLERDMARVRVGQHARLTIGAYPDRIFRGQVEFLYPALNPATRTLQARIELANPDLLLRPGMYGDAFIELGASDAVAVPDDAVVDTGGTQYVFVAGSAGQLAPRRVAVGSRAEGWVEIVSGLTAGETVVTTGNFLVDSESRLRAALENRP
ncbi:MAG TPA: efflux RND transporter periplasmic adaptor subunit [Myxococcales bacterium]|nr:efflux RND transporter periplasmic adaptor subunit [Myxococcales bacterium]